MTLAAHARVAVALAACSFAVSALALGIVIALSPVAGSASRPLLDQRQWNAYFSLFAPDISVPWRPARVRLDTYSAAPVDFTAYQVEPSDVIVAGGKRQARALDTSRRRPVARWRFSPPAGFRFMTNDVDVPLGDREGFFVIEARRGAAAEQVWLNRTRLGLLVKESPEGLMLWATDLGSGRAIRGAAVEFFSGPQMVMKSSDENGVIAWFEPQRPNFALANFGGSRSFVSLSPPAPLPASIVGLRLESPVARAGGTVRFAGFARKRVSAGVRPLSGDVRVVLSAQGKPLSAVTERLDAAGAFASQLPIPANTAGGMYTVAASAVGAVGTAALTVDAAAADTRLSIAGTCPCAAANEIPFTVLAQRGDRPVADLAVTVRVVRTPHVLPPGIADDAPRWGTTTVFDRTLRTDRQGRARVSLAAPSDGLASTYGVRAASAGASATTRIVVPTAPFALAVEPDVPRVDPSGAIGIALRGFDALDGTPRAGLNVRVVLAHGVLQQEQSVRLDERGRAHIVFRGANEGTNLVLADVAEGTARALDASSVVVAPSASAAARRDHTVQIGLDRPRYRSNDRATVTLGADGLVGDAFVTVEGARIFGWSRFPASGANPRAAVDLNDPQGDVRVSAAAVRDGAIVQGSTQLSVDAPGRMRLLSLGLDRTTYTQGDTAKVTLRDGDAHGSGTAVIRISDARANGSANFDDAAMPLRAGGTTSQAPASENVGWHTGTSSGSPKPSAFAGDASARRNAGPPALGAAALRTLLWRTERSERETFDLVLPKERGRFILSVMKAYDDGDVGAASIGVTVQ
jgi:hypothetical protein